MLANILIIIGGCLGAISAFQLQKLGFNPIVASCLVGLAGTLIGTLLKTEDLALVIFAGSFVGMTAVSITSFPLILLAGLICGILYLIAEPIFDGYGGKLGAMAFVSVVVVMVVKEVG
jgi:hypothetical protein